jgi:ABC-type tungstate transport system permease subunit
VSVSKLDKHIVTTAVELLKFLMNERGDSLLSDFQVDFERVYEEVQQTNDDDKSP